MIKSNFTGGCVMATHKSAEKKYRRDLKRRMINKMNRSKMRNKIKSFRSTIKAGKIDEAQKLFPQVIASIDQTISKGIIHQNTGARYKSRLNILMNKSIKKV
jgi:small subunit ribosomal protein S20